jgi:hypothetical protein
VYCRRLRARQEVRPVSHHHHPALHVPDAHRKVDRGLPFARRVPRVDIGRADLEFGHRRHAVLRLQRIVGRRLRVLVQVDEPRRHHVSAGVDRRRSVERRFRDRADHAAADADVAHGIETRLGIHHAAAAQDEVEVLRRQRRDKQPGDKREPAAPARAGRAV